MQRCIKRIDEFTSRGYDVEAYGFDRGVEAKKKPHSIIIHVVGKIDNSTPYKKRMMVIYKGVKEILRRTKLVDSVYYIFGLDNCLFFSLLSNKPYIYEESDLVHTYMNNRLSIRFFECLDKRIIKKSLLTVFTSEGFLRYHFGKNFPFNTCVVANKLPMEVKELKNIPTGIVDINHLKIGFVGFLRFKSIFNFAKVFCQNFPNNEFHFYGTANNESDRLLFEPLKKMDNCFFHGTFKHPDELPEIYSKIDLVLSTYDVSNENVRYAEPNKIYESIFFDTPIIVSSKTFLGQKVQELGIGFEIDALNDIEVISFINNLTSEIVDNKIQRIRALDKQIALNNNEELFSFIKSNIHN